MNKTTLYLGLNDAQSKTQVITTEDALSIVYALLIDEYELPGATIQQANGIYKHDDGSIVIENTIIIILLDVEREVILNIVADLKRIFNQECLLVEQSIIDYNFI